MQKAGGMPPVSVVPIWSGRLEAPPEASLSLDDLRQNLQWARGAGLRKPEERIALVVTLLASGCMVHAFALDERIVARWHESAGPPCQNVHEPIDMQRRCDAEHVQAAGIQGKGSA